MENKTLFLDTINYERTCGDCSICCQGWLSGQIYEYFMNPGIPCHFNDTTKCGGGCTIYEHRPLMCKEYKCVWLQQSKLFPEWFRPDKSKLIITDREYKEEFKDANGEKSVFIKYWQIIECGQQIDSKYLNWLIIQASAYNINIEYQVNGKWYYMGSEQFKNAFGNKVTSSAEILE
jgi:hypothetical protein